MKKAIITTLILIAAFASFSQGNPRQLFWMLNKYHTSYDPDAVAYANAIGITDNTILLATDSMVVQLKRMGIWNNIVSWNWLFWSTKTKDAIDFKTATTIGFFNTTGCTATSNGVAFDGTNGYYDLGYSLYQKSVPEFNCSYGYGRVTNNNPSSSHVDFGIHGLAAGGKYVDFYSASARYDGNAYVAIGDGNQFVINPSTTDGRYRVIATRVSSTDLRMYKNGTQFGSTQTATATEVFSSNQTSTGANLALACLNNLNTLNQTVAFHNYYSPNTFSFVFVLNTALTSSQAAQLDSYINTYLTACGVNQSL